MNYLNKIFIWQVNEMKEKINKIMEPARLAMNCIDYNEGIVIGSSFGQLISIIEEQQKKIEELERKK